MRLVATLLDSTTLKHPRVSVREIVNPLKLVAKVCFRVHCTFLWGGVYLYKIFKSISDPPRFNRKWQISQSWILWYLKVGITELGGVLCPWASIILAGSDSGLFIPVNMGQEMWLPNGWGGLPRACQKARKTIMGMRGHYLRFADQCFPRFMFYDELSGHQRNRNTVIFSW